MITPRPAQSAAAAGAWQRAAQHSGLWRVLRPFRRAWLVVERGVASVAGATGTACENTRAEEAVRESWLFQTADTTLNRVILAWHHSVLIGMGRQLTNQVLGVTPDERLRATAGMALAASVTVLVFRLLFRPEPLSWVVPAATALGALVVMAAARGLTAAWKHRR